VNKVFLTVELSMSKMKRSHESGYSKRKRKILAVEACSKLPRLDGFLKPKPVSSQSNGPSHWSVLNEDSVRFWIQKGQSDC